MQAFFDGCYKTGPERCAFYADSSETIAANLAVLYKKVRTNPIAVKVPNGYDVVDWTTLRDVIFQAMYKPYTTYTDLAEALAQLAAGSGHKLLNMKAKQLPTCNGPGSSKGYATNHGVTEATWIVACNDGKAVPTDLPSTQNYYDDMTRKFEFGSRWASMRLSCA